MHELKHPFVLGSACAQVGYQGFSTGVYPSIQAWMEGYTPVASLSYEEEGKNAKSSKTM
jgi:hypothetical protein